MKKMLINARDPDLVRAAIIATDGRLEEVDFDYSRQATHLGNIYKAQVVRIENSLGAAFVDFGGVRNGFLPLREVSAKVLKEAYGSRRKGPAPQDGVLERGQEVMVQATREPMGTKGAAMTTYVALPGRYLVYLPDGETEGISRKIQSRDERSKLSDLVKSVRGKKDVGLIVRTAGLASTKAELQKDFRYLDRLWKDVLKSYRDHQGPGLIWREHGTAIRAVRDYYNDEVGEIWVDNPEVFEEIARFFDLTGSKTARERLKLYDQPQPLFSKYGVEEQIEQTRRRQVALPSGGSIVIDPTEALVAVDVNSGKQRGEKNIEETALKTNCEAAEEISRQLRLRNLGGIIVIDFIDMRDRKKRAQVERALRDAVKPDKANITLGRIGRFGTLEMLRQRLRTSGAGAGYVSCEHCGGSGRRPSVELAGLEALRAVRARAAESPSGSKLVVTLAAPTALYLLNQRRHQIAEIERGYGVEIVVEPAAGEVPLEQPPQIAREGGAQPPPPLPTVRPQPKAPSSPEPRREPPPQTGPAAAKPVSAAPQNPKDPEASGEPRKRRRRGSRGGRGRKRPVEGRPAHPQHGGHPQERPAPREWAPQRKQGGESGETSALKRLADEIARGVPSTVEPASRPAEGGRRRRGSRGGRGRRRKPAGA